MVPVYHIRRIKNRPDDRERSGRKAQAKKKEGKSGIRLREVNAPPPF
jgi:hypothetical protein